jgi:hypothetical protein
LDQPLARTSFIACSRGTSVECVTSDSFGSFGTFGTFSIFANTGCLKLVFHAKLKARATRRALVKRAVNGGFTLKGTRALGGQKLG